MCIVCCLHFIVKCDENEIHFLGLIRKNEKRVCSIYTLEPSKKKWIVYVFEYEWESKSRWNVSREINWFEIHVTVDSPSQVKLFSSLYRCVEFLCPCLTNVVVIICSLYIVLSVGFIDVEIIGKEKGREQDKRDILVFILTYLRFASSSFSPSLSLASLPHRFNSILLLL